MIYRQATLFDVVDISTLWDESVSEIPERLEKGMCQELFLATLIGTFYNDNVYIGIAEHETEVVGFIYGCVKKEEYHTDKLVGYCEDIYILPEHRGGEVYNKLLEYGIEFMKSMGCTEVEGVCINDKVRNKFYERQGFKPVQVVYRKEI